MLGMGMTAGEAVFTAGRPNRESKTTTYAFLALLSFLTVLIVRPAELMPALEPLRLAVVTFGIALVLWIASGRRAVFWGPWTNRCAIGLLMLMLLSIPFSCWPSRSVEEVVIYLKQVTVFFLIVNVLQSVKSVKQLLAVVAAAQAFHAAIIIKRYVSGELVLDRVFGVAGGVFSDPNDLALNFVMMVPVCLFLMQSSRPWWGRVAAGALGLLFAVAIFATQSRGGFLGLIVILGMTLIESRSKWLLAGLVLAGGMMAVMAVPPETFERYRTIREYQSDPSAMIRLHVWKAGLQMWSDHPILGVGVGTFPIAYGTAYRDPAFANPVWYDSHNSPIKVLAEMGAPGLFVWCGMIVTGLTALSHIVRRLRRSSARNSDVAELAALAQTVRASIVGYLICGMFLARSYDWMLMVFLGLAVTSGVIAQRYLESHPIVVNLPAFARRVIA